MKTIQDIISISEDAGDIQTIEQKIDGVFRNNQTKLSKMIQARQDLWDSGKGKTAHEPMFLIAEPQQAFQTTDDNAQPQSMPQRDYSWVRYKHIKGHEQEFEGTFKNYNTKNDEGTKPNSVIGIYYDRHFEFITSLKVFNDICEILRINNMFK